METEFPLNVSVEKTIYLMFVFKDILYWVDK